MNVIAGSALTQAPSTEHRHNASDNTDFIDTFQTNWKPESIPRVNKHMAIAFLNHHVKQDKPTGECHKSSLALFKNK